MPFFNVGDDPGPDFAALVRRAGLTPAAPPGDASSIDVTHGTTVIAIRFAGGVVMAGDRRATAGNVIAHRDMEKVCPADRYSGVAIAGAAGPAMEMVKLFQLQLEHYEKVEGSELSLEGKANQLAAMVRGHLPMAIQGFVVVPLFAGYDRRRGEGRLFQYDVTGGRYEDTNYAGSGSGSIYASTVVKLGFREGMSADEAVDLSLLALFQAADDDSATGGPDLVRGIFPVIATITDSGFERLTDDDLRERVERLVSELSPATGAPVPPSGPPPSVDPAPGG
ncbi:MAG: proteasome subunit beta [Actinomycetota bacterium]|nr:proteasome subunit beta [Actinomycetota bacterium]